MAVLDGDTIDVLHDRRAIRVRLAEIDAPEKRQAFGQRSRQALADLVFRRHVKVLDRGSERHGRTLGIVMVAGINVNEELVRWGHAWVYRSYSRDETLVQYEQLAKGARRGLWADPGAVPPWVYRKSRP
ncbi:thermonuclease family protein [Eleftheria terrae]|uniref:thermonuclease family protein n=1 Tax=Eleftheria terrae TaxID=1597781 RepID=UPI00263A4969|nr:thermonuclease family protein [Eleftheria terrae]WKB50546.1 thermonuclease family protein [Eleftheria terrae]